MDGRVGTSPAAGTMENGGGEEGGELRPRHRGCHTDGCQGNVAEGTLSPVAPV